MKLNRNKIKRSKLRKYIQSILAKNMEICLDEIMEAIDEYEKLKYSEGYMKSFSNSLLLPDNKKLYKFIVGSVKETINRHGSITKELIGSAAKRIYMLIAGYNSGDN